VAEPPSPHASGAERRAAFERVALPFVPALYRTARRVSLRIDDAGDLVQETLLRAYRTFDSFRTGTNAKAWLFTILYSIQSNIWRRDRQNPGEVALDDVEERFQRAVVGRTFDAEQQLLARLDASAEVDGALRRLPDAYRAAVLLVDVEELTYEEAAVALDCPVGTVRSRLARGRKLLFVELHDYAQRIGALQDK
jgi:RNA polymerase sigma-70 factor (ECF subfamily)